MSDAQRDGLGGGVRIGEVALGHLFHERPILADASATYTVQLKIGERTAEISGVSGAWMNGKTCDEIWFSIRQAIPVEMASRGISP